MPTPSVALGEEATGCVYPVSPLGAESASVISEQSVREPAGAGAGLLFRGNQMGKKEAPQPNPQWGAVVHQALSKEERGPSPAGPPLTAHAMSWNIDSGMTQRRFPTA